MGAAPEDFRRGSPPRRHAVAARPVSEPSESPADSDDPILRVVAGVLMDPQGRVLIAQRPPGKHLAGGWEFPGGKRAADESRESALAREFIEELGVEVKDARPLIRYVHAYPERTVELDVWRILGHTGEPRGLEGQAIDWCAPEGLMAHELLPADKPIVTALTLSPLCVVTGGFADTANFVRRLESALRIGAGLVQLRQPGAGTEQLLELGAVAAPVCRRHGARLVVNTGPEQWSTLRESGLFDGLHLAARRCNGLRVRPVEEDVLLGVSCHSADELARAASIDTDYAVLGSVKVTASHPGGATLGWDAFSDYAAPCRFPVYAIGGLNAADLPRAWQAGAQGVAAIRGLWRSDRGRAR